MTMRLKAVSPKAGEIEIDVLYLEPPRAMLASGGDRAEALRDTGNIVFQIPDPDHAQQYRLLERSRLVLNGYTMIIVAVAANVYNQYQAYLTYS